METLLRRWRDVGILVLLGLLLAWLTGCSGTPDAERIRAAIDAGAAAAEQGDASALGDVLAEDFVGNDGQFDRRRLLGLLRVYRLRGQTPGALRGPVSIEPRGDRMLASFTLTLSGLGRTTPTSVAVFKVETAWRIEDGDWRCYSAHWQRRL